MSETVNQYPFGSLPRRLVIAGKKEKGALHGKLIQLQRVANLKRGGDSQGNPSETIDYQHYGAVMAERRKREMSADEESNG